MGGFLGLEMNAGRDGREIDEGAAGGLDEQVVAGAGEDVLHRLIVGDDGEDDVGLGGDVGELFGRVAFEFLGQAGGRFAAHIVDAEI